MWSPLPSFRDMPIGHIVWITTLETPAKSFSCHSATPHRQERLRLTCQGKAILGSNMQPMAQLHGSLLETNEETVFTKTSPLWRSMWHSDKGLFCFCTLRILHRTHSTTKSVLWVSKQTKGWWIVRLEKSWWFGSNAHKENGRVKTKPNQTKTLGVGWGLWLTPMILAPKNRRRELIKVQEQSEQAQDQPGLHTQCDPVSKVKQKSGQKWHLLLSPRAWAWSPGPGRTSSHELTSDFHTQENRLLQVVLWAHIGPYTYIDT